MLTLEHTTTTPAVSRLNPSHYLTAFVVGSSLLVLLSGSLKLAIAWVMGVQALWILCETLATTVFAHRSLTHGALVIKKKWFVRFWLWWTRSGMVKYWEWVQNHAAHHALTDTPQDSYTPQADMVDIATPALRPPRPWRFLDNARAYTRTSQLYASDQGKLKLQALAEKYPEVRRALDRLKELSWARTVYGNVTRALMINWALFAVASLPLAVRLGIWWFLPVMAVLPWAMIGLKVYLYLIGGYIINYFGHQAQKSPYQSDIPWSLMLITLFTMGEGWHEYHHDAPFSARFHRVLDPGWWVIVFSAKLKLVTAVVVSEKVAPRQYRHKLLQSG